MSLRSIIAVATGGEGDERSIGVASQLAARHTGAVRVVPAFPDMAAAFVAYGEAFGAAPGSAAERIAAGEAQQLEMIREVAHGAAQRHKLGAERLRVLQRGLQPAVELGKACVLADLAVFDAAAARSEVSGLFAECLLNMRTPVLLAKRGEVSGAVAAIAWDGSAQAGRAVQAALPLLASATEVLVLQNRDESVSEPKALEEYLGLHGVNSVRLAPVHGSDIAASLMEAASAAGADLLVAGGYGRPRLYELALGGATRGFVTVRDGPNILLAH